MSGQSQNYVHTNTIDFWGKDSFGLDPVNFLFCMNKTQMFVTYNAKIIDREPKMILLCKCSHVVKNIDTAET